jgi:hypothetical protein
VVWGDLKGAHTTTTHHRGYPGNDRRSSDLVKMAMHMQPYRLWASVVPSSTGKSDVAPVIGWVVRPNVLPQAALAIGETLYLVLPGDEIEFFDDRRTAEAAAWGS